MLCQLSYCPSVPRPRNRPPYEGARVQGVSTKSGSLPESVGRVEPTDSDPPPRIRRRPPANPLPARRLAAIVDAMTPIERTRPVGIGGPAAAVQQRDATAGTGRPRW
ncbi:hypothetical protein GCM10022236_18730 [Microlunatus ginsengisoli]|uniref:Uncharacterized protein n=1 Tax=Microlunatus ginsengisoli TaxID=363863 RepID=A0ABP6ZSX5_9ACTN